MDLKDITLVFLDIETTGWSPQKDKIIEIYASKVLNGVELESFHTLLNPNLRLSKDITYLTGITFDDLIASPSFEEISNKLLMFLEDHIIVAHNARFDYGFIKREFANLGVPFKNKYMCTVRLSKTLFPQYRKHGLDQIINRFNIDLGERHRAKYDTQAIKVFFDTCKSTFSEEIFCNAITRSIKESNKASHIDLKIIKNISSSYGIYIFESEHKYPLYVGFSKNLKKRVLSHLQDDIHIDKEFNISKQTKSIKTIKTCGELGALLREIYLIKTLKPLYNKKLRTKEAVYFVNYKKNSDGYYEIMKAKNNDKISEDNIDSTLVFNQGEKYYKFISNAFVKNFGLCAKLLDIEQAKSECFYHKLKLCKGACINAVEPDLYNKTFLECYKPYTILAWPFRSAVVIREENKDSFEEFLVYKWYLAGTNLSSKKSLNNKYFFDYNIYLILKKHIENNRLYTKQVDFLSELNNFGEFDIE